MNIVEQLKTITMGLCALVLAFSLAPVYAQEEDHEEEEELLQTRPNPMDKTTRMKGADRQWDPFDKSMGKMMPGASRAAPQTMQPGMKGSMQMKPGMQAPNLQDDGEHGGMMNPQQMAPGQ